MRDETEWESIEDIETSPKRKKRFNSLDLWKKYREFCIDKFPEMKKLPRRPMVKILANLKKMINEYGKEDSTEYLRLCVKDWMLFKKKYKVKSQYPDIVQIFYRRTEEIISCLENEGIVIESNVFRANENDVDISDWLQ